MSIVYSNLNHALRVPLAAEVHSRPPLRLTASESVTHFAVYARGAAHPAEGNGYSQHQLLCELCAHFGVAGPGSDAKYFFHDFGRFRMKWECHTEFATYTFAQAHAQPLSVAAAFAQIPVSQLPQQWLQALHGKIMVAAHLVLDQQAAPIAVPDAELLQVFEGNALAAGKVAQGGQIWTDFRIHADGFNRFLVCAVGPHEQQAARLVQRILEIETYRMMALLGLPLAQQSAPVLNAIEDELARLTATMVDADQAIAGAPENADDEQALLRKITGLAARIEKLSLENNYRFSASQAYFRLVRARIDELHEMRIEGVPTIGEFMDRRLAPAMNTCEAIARRQEALAERIAHTNDLLRTRVGIVQEQQNRKILQSLNTRAAQQLRLQQAVEGLSVVAISYYLAGLCNYAGKAMKAAGWPVNPDIATGMLVPLLTIGVWLGLRRMRRHIHIT